MTGEPDISNSIVLDGETEVDDVQLASKYASIDYFVLEKMRNIPLQTKVPIPLNIGDINEESDISESESVENETESEINLKETDLHSEIAKIKENLQADHMDPGFVEDSELNQAELDSLLSICENVKPIKPESLTKVGIVTSVVGKTISAKAEPDMNVYANISPEQVLYDETSQIPKSLYMTEDDKDYGDDDDDNVENDSSNNETSDLVNGKLNDATSNQQECTPKTASVVKKAPLAKVITEVSLTPPTKMPMHFAPWKKLKKRSFKKPVSAINEMALRPPLLKSKAPKFKQKNKVKTFFAKPRKAMPLNKISPQIIHQTYPIIKQQMPKILNPSNMYKNYENSMDQFSNRMHGYQFYNQPMVPPSKQMPPQYMHMQQNKHLPKQMEAKQFMIPHKQYSQQHHQKTLPAPQNNQLGKQQNQLLPPQNRIVPIKHVLPPLPPEQNSSNQTSKYNQNTSTIYSSLPVNHSYSASPHESPTSTYNNYTQYNLPSNQRNETVYESNNPTTNYMVNSGEDNRKSYQNYNSNYAYYSYSPNKCSSTGYSSNSYQTTSGNQQDSQLNLATLGNVYDPDIQTSLNHHVYHDSFSQYNSEYNSEQTSQQQNNPYISAIPKYTDQSSGSNQPNAMAYYKLQQNSSTYNPSYGYSTKTQSSYPTKYSNYSNSLSNQYDLYQK